MCAGVKQEKLEMGSEGPVRMMVSDHSQDNTPYHSSAKNIRLVQLKEDK